ncbi:MAG: TetR family transcriptional regulator [Rhodospirillaceae bacterium]|nr:TetR family transcriptional regulator [Rhodospirillaceae bacterium]
MPQTRRTGSRRRRGPAGPDDARWQTVLDAAAREFAHRGFLAASTTAIARRLGLKQGSLYYYIPSKRRALELVCQVSTEAMLGGLGEIAAGPGKADEKLRRAIDFHVAWLAGRPNYCFTFLRERKHVTGAAGRLLADTARRYESLFEAIVSEGVAAGRFRADCDPARTGFAILAAINAFALGAHHAHRALDPGLGAWIAALMLPGLAATAPARRNRRPNA